MTYIIVGKIVNTHGLRGSLKLMSASDFMEARLSNGIPLYIVNGQKQITSVTIKSHSESNNGLYIINLLGLDHINDVEQYKGLSLAVKAVDLPILSNHEFYVNDLVGLPVFEDDIKIGILEDILPTGSNDVFIIKTNGKKLLLPFQDKYIKIDLANKRIIAYQTEDFR